VTSVRWGRVRRDRNRNPVASDISKTQIDGLGDRLRKGNITDDDLRLLDEYRRSFAEAYEFVVGEIRKLQLNPTGRPAKSTTSISEKLLRESIRLSQIQDIAGCRLVMSDVANQQRTVESLCLLFGQARITDRRAQPSHGYRAVHIIVKRGDRTVEVQVRTLLQHIWAELSEKLSDVVDPGIKYGMGDQAIVKILLDASALVAQAEDEEIHLTKLQQAVSVMLVRAGGESNKHEQLMELDREIFAAQQNHMHLRQAVFDFLRNAIDQVPTRE
jgi:putative GTP pyrophosphokinase